MMLLIRTMAIKTINILHFILFLPYCVTYSFIMIYGITSTGIGDIGVTLVQRRKVTFLSPVIITVVWIRSIQHI